MAFVLTVDGVEVQDDLSFGSLDINKQANGRASLSFRLLSEDGSVRPVLDQEVILSDAGETIVGGFISDPEEQGFGGPNVLVPIETTIQVSDYNSLAQRRFVTAAIAAGTTLKAVLTIIVAYLPGVSLDPAQVDGPALTDAIDWADVKAEDCLNELTTLTGFLWKVTPGKKLLGYETGTVAAPFNIAPGSTVITKVSVKPMRQGYANRVIVRTATARKVAEDVSAAADPWEIVVAAPDNTGDDAVQGLADAILAQSLPVLKQLKYDTYEAGLEPGQTQTVNLPGRGINNTFLVTEVVSYEEHPGVLLHKVTAIEGLVYRTGWRELYKIWSKGSAALVGGAGVGSAVSFQRFAYFLGGNGIDATRSAGPTWVPASGGKASGQGAIQVQISTTVRGTRLATVNVRLRALEAGVTVKARLFDVTDNVACPGESAVVTNTNWEFASFGVTLTSGNHLYELQLLPGTANADVLGTGYLE